MTQAVEPPTPPARHPDAQRFLTNHWNLNRTLSRHLGPLIERDHQVSMKDLLVLGYIQAGTRYPTELAEALQVPKHMASRIIDELLTRQLIGRSIDQTDARRTRLEISPLGSDVLSAALSTVDASLEQLFAQLPSGRRTEVLAAIETLAQAAQSAFGEPS